VLVNESAEPIMPAFVGRVGELAALAAELRAVRGGRPRVVLIDGEPGVGKSSLLSRFLSAQTDVSVLRASGDEAEMLVAWGVVDQLMAADGSANTPPSRPAGAAGWEGADPVAVGVQLVTVLGDLQFDERVVVVVVDDLHWSDQLSAQALLFAVRRLRADRVLGLMAARPGGLSRLGEGWNRFVGGDERVTRLRLGGLCAADVAALARTLGAGDLSARAVARLLEHTGGNALHCRALIEELSQGDLARADRDLPAPRALADVVLGRLEALSQPARGLVAAAAVLGRRCPLALAGALAELINPLPALDEAVAGGLVVEDLSGSAAQIAFPHRLVHVAVRDGLGPAQRHRLHAAAAELVPAPAALTHRVAAAVGPDDRLADDLEMAAGEATRQGQAAWLAQASVASTAEPQKERHLLDAVAALMSCGDVHGALALWPAVAQLGPSARRSALLGNLDLLCGRGSVVEAHLLEAWQAHDPRTEPLVGAAAATSLAAYLCTDGRPQEAVAWAERAVAASGEDPTASLQALIVTALGLTLSGRGPEGLARLSRLPAVASEVPLEDSDGLVMRGMCRLFTDDVTGAASDLSVSLARYQAATSGLSGGYPGQCLVYLADAEYRLGAWDDALVHSEMAVALARDADRTWDLAFAHAYAAMVPASRGDWSLADGHVEASRAAARAFGAGTAVTTAAWADAELASARGDLEGVLSALSAVRALGRLEVFGLPGWADWRPLEVDALIGLGRLDDAEAAVTEFDAAIPAGLRSASLAVARLRGALAAARGDAPGAEEWFAAARGLAEGLPLPFQLALLERDDGRRLRRAGDRGGAVVRLRRARDCFLALGALPQVAACERELAGCGVEVAPEPGPARWRLTPSELAVARLVCTGRSNREVAAELYVSVKAVEFHLGNVFDKVGIRSRKALPGMLAAPGAATSGNRGGQK
jgi:DNA-binding CsgD family transcriptional regulator/tetratricopeptide (TPR) repeat protein